MLRLCRIGAVGLALLMISRPVLSDVLLVFPEGTSSADVAAATQAVERSSGLPVRGISLVARVEEPAERTPPREASGALEEARERFRNLELDGAGAYVKTAREACLGGGVLSRCGTLLFEAELLEGMIEMARGDQPAAERSFRTAHSFEPERVVDPRKYPPKTVAAFNRACSREGGGFPLEVSAKPEGAAILVNGESVEGGGLHAGDVDMVVVEASMLGYRPALVGVARPKEGVARASFELEPVPKDAAWQDLKEALASAGATGDRDVTAVLKRFGIDHVVFLDRAGEGAGASYRAGLAALGQRTPAPLAEVTGSMELGEVLGEALKRALGVGGSPEGDEPERLVPMILEPGPDEVDDDMEDSLARFGDVDGSDDAGTGEAAKIFRSPWFWVGVGVVVAVVGGVVIGTQVGD